MIFILVIWAFIQIIDKLMAVFIFKIAQSLTVIRLCFLVI